MCNKKIHNISHYEPKRDIEYIITIRAVDFFFLHISTSFEREIKKVFYFFVPSYEAWNVGKKQNCEFSSQTVNEFGVCTWELIG